MPEKEPSQELEVANSKVRERARLTSFFPNDPNANMRSLNHIYIIGSISDSQSCRIFAMFSYKADQSCLLFRWWSVNDKPFCLHESIYNFLALIRSALFFNCLNENRDGCPTNHDVFITALSYNLVNQRISIYDGFMILCQLKHFSLVVQYTTIIADWLCCGVFITCDNPNLDACLDKVTYALLDIFLEFISQARNSN